MSWSPFSSPLPRNPVLATQEAVLRRGVTSSHPQPYGGDGNQTVSHANRLPPAWLDPWFRSPPTVTEINQVLQDFNLQFDRNTGIPPLLTDGGRRYGAQHHAGSVQDGVTTDSLVFFVKTFQLLDRIRFIAPLPIFGDRPYDWVKSLCRQGVFFSISEGPIPLGSLFPMAFTRDNAITITTNNIDAQGKPLEWGSFPYSVPSLLTIASTILHECRHTLAGGHKPHDCGRGDSSLDYSGAVAANYWWLLGCLEYSTDAPVDADALQGMVAWCRSWICKKIIPPTAATPVRPGGDAALVQTDRTTNPLIRANSPSLVKPVSLTLSDDQVRQILWSSWTVDDPATQQALVEYLHLPWSVISRLLRII